MQIGRCCCRVGQEKEIVWWRLFDTCLDGEKLQQLVFLF